MTPKEQREAISRICNLLKGTKPKILLVEDSPDDAFAFTRTLAQHGLKAFWVVSIDQAIDALKTEPYQIIFLDLKMPPPGHWLDLLNFVKSQQMETQVIVLTGAFAQDDHECKEALKQGASAVILKPLTTEQVHLIFGTV